MVCKKCGREIMETAKFCTFCGAPVSPQSNAPVRPQSNAQAQPQPYPVYRHTAPARQKSRFPLILTCCLLGAALLLTGGVLLGVTLSSRAEKTEARVPVSQSGESASDESGAPTEATEAPVAEGELLLAAGEYEVAVELFSAEIAAAPDDPLGYLHRADAYAAWGYALFHEAGGTEDVLEKYRLAAEDYDTAAQADPDLPQGDAPCIAYCAAAQSCQEAGDSAEAMRWAALSRDALESGSVSEAVRDALEPLVSAFFDVSDQVLLEERFVFTAEGSGEAARYGRTEYLRDRNGRLVEKRTYRADSEDAEEWTPDSETFYVYDANGAVLSEVTMLHYADLSSDVPEEISRTVVYFYDDLGRIDRTVTARIPADGSTSFARTEYYYDDADHPTCVSSTSARALDVTNWYSAVSGNTCGTGAGNTKFTYDEAGREIHREIWGDEGSTDSTYDGAGRLLQVTDREYFGTTVTDFIYGSPPQSNVPAGSAAVEFSGLRVEIPAGWDGKFLVLPTPKGIRFCAAADWPDMGGGLVTLSLYAEGEEYDYLPAHEVVGTLRKGGQTWTLVAIYPTDVQFSMETAEAYNALAEAVPELFMAISAVDGAVFTPN